MKNGNTGEKRIMFRRWRNRKTNIRGRRLRREKRKVTDSSNRNLTFRNRIKGERKTNIGENNRKNLTQIENMAGGKKRKKQEIGTEDIEQ